MAIVLASLSSSTGFAWDQEDYVVEVGTYDDGHAMVKFQNASWHHCSGTGWFSIGRDGESKHKTMVAVATTALATGKKVYISTGGCTGNEEIVGRSRYAAK